MSNAPQIAIPATYMRGGTSNAVVFHAKDLPRDRAAGARRLPRFGLAGFASSVAKGIGGGFPLGIGEQILQVLL